MNAPRHHNALAAGYSLHWYRIESVLGQGGFGITYLATDTNLDQPVAIKEFLPSDLAVRTRDSAVHPVSDARSDTFGWGLNRFLSEARTLAQFRHPNIVRVYSVFEANGTAYMVMEYEQGTSLEDALKFRRLEGERALVSLVHALVDGLELVHQAGFVHRDIKPDNIFMRAQDGVPVLLDFGSARQAMGMETRTLTSLVTPGYAPFEQYNATRENDRQGPWTDIYSLAATLYRGITGAGPIDAVARADALLSGSPDPLIPLATLEPMGFSPTILAAVDAGLAFQPGDRPQDLTEWRAMLPARPTSPDFAAAARSVRPSMEVDSEDETVVRGGPPSRREPTAPQTGPDVAAGPPTDAPTAEPVAAAAAVSPAPASADTKPVTAFGGSGKVIGAIAVLVLAAVVFAAWKWLEPGESAPAAPETAATETPVVSPSSSNGDEAARLAAERERLEVERRALEAERERLALEERKRQMEVAKRAAEEEARRIAADRARLERERLELEKLRAAEAARVAEEVRQAEAARLAEETRLAAEAARRAEAVRAEEARRLAEETRRLEAERAAEVQRRAQAERLAEAAREQEAERLAQEQAQAVAAQASDRDARVASLLAAADADLEALRLTSPAGGNAFERYRAVLEQDPGNERAVAGLAAIVSRYLRLSADAVRREDFQRSEQMLARAARVDPDSDEVAQARSRLAASRAESEAREAEQRRLAQEAAAREQAEREQTRREAERIAAREREQARAAEEARRASELAEAERRAREKAAAEERARAAARTVNLAVFPHDSIRTCFYSVGSRLHDAGLNAANASGDVSLVYSFYVRNADASVVGRGDRLWQGTAAKKSPRVPAVQSAARTLGADAVLMAWYDCHSIHGVDEDMYRADVYLVDVRSGKVYFASRGLLDTGKAVAQVLRALYAARGR